MGKLVVNSILTLDGVMQGPGGPDEDTRGGFSLGGWAAPYNDDIMGQAMAEGMRQTRAMLFGRRTYEQFASFWPHQPENDPFASHMTRLPKYVVSSTLREPLPWANSFLLRGDPFEAIARLKEETDGDIVILGSGELVQSLMGANLINEYSLLIHPLVLGTGRRLFTDSGVLARLKLIRAVPTSTGVILTTYRPITDDPSQ